MRDNEKASLIALICFSPFAPVLIFYSLFGPVFQVEFWGPILFGLLLVWGGILTFMLLKDNPRVMHYHRASMEFEKNYRYGGTSGIMAQFLAACRGMGITLFNHDIRENQHFITVEIPQEGFECPECGKESKQVKRNEFECPDCGIFSGPFVFTPSNKEAQ